MSRGKSHEQFLSEVYNLVGEEYIVLGTYSKGKDKIAIEHVKCGYILNVKASHFLHDKTRCPRCAGNERYTTDSFKKKVLEIKGEDYTILGEYTSTHSHILIKHEVCNHEWNVMPSNLLRGTGCPNCYGNALCTNELFIEKVFNLVKDEYKVLGTYVGSFTKILIKHNECNHEYEVTPDNFLRGKRCPNCNSSKGEHLLNKILTERGIKFEREFRIDDCRNILPLPFDFVVFDSKYDIDYLIEFDGIQHFVPSFGEKSFNITVRNDIIKNKFCEDNNIKLVRIPYYDIDRIEEIIDNVI